MNARFDLEDMGLADMNVGVKTIRTQNGLVLSQSHYMYNVVEKINKDDTSVAQTSIINIDHLSKNIGEGVT